MSNDSTALGAPEGLTSSSTSASSSSLVEDMIAQAAAAESGHEYLIVLPFIVLFGLCGNCISLVAILHSRLRKMPANQYLVVLTIADSVFLLGIILLLFKVDFMGFLPCVLVEYLLMTSSYVSSWSIAALTLERYLAIAHPLRHVQYGHISRWKAMGCWLPVPFLLNLVQFYSLSPSTDPGSRKCEVKDGQLQMAAELSDVLLCYCLPCCIVVALNLLIASKVRSAGRRFISPSPPFKKTPLHSQSSLCPNNSATKKSPDSAKCSIGSVQANSRKNSSRSLQVPITSRTAGGSAPTPSSAAGTRILLVVPVVYILLNTPFYLFRILDTVALNLFNSKAFQGDGLAANPVLAWLYNTAHYLYYVNFACDVLVYAFSSANFRRTVLIAWCRLLCPTAGWASEKEIGGANTRFTNGGGAGTSNSRQLSTRRLLLSQSPSQPKLAQPQPTQQQQPQSQRNGRQRVSLEVDGDEARRPLAKRLGTK